MGSIKIVDDILAPREYLRINYKGENPFIVCTMIRELFKKVMKISSKDIFEPDIRWDVTGDPRGFYNVWRGVYTHDRWTKSQVRIIIQGEQSVKDKKGWVTIILKGTTETEYNYSNFIQKCFWFFYNYAFYYKQRRVYIDYAKDFIYTIRDRLLEALNIKQD